MHNIVKYRFRPYHVMLLLAAAAALGFTRINKLDFYHRYFRVISEIEDRNSQELDDANTIQWSDAAQGIVEFSPAPAGVFVAPQYFQSTLSFASYLPALADLPKQISLVWGLYPTRAP